MTNEEKQELVRKIWIANSILVIALIMGFLPGSWFLVLCSIGVAWPVEKKIEEVFSKEIRYVRDKLFGFFDAVYDNRIKPTRLGRFLDNTFSSPGVPIVNDLEETDTDIDDEEHTEVESIASTVVSTESEFSRQDSDPESYNESTSSKSSTRKIAFGLKQSISSQFSNCATESKHSGYDSDIGSYSDSASRTSLSTENDDEISRFALSTESNTDEEEMDFVELTENDDQATHISVYRRL